MIVSIYMKSTGQIIQNRTVETDGELDVLSDDYGYVEGNYSPEVNKWDGSSVVAYSPPYVSGENSSKVRAERNRILAESDWTQMADSSLTDSKKSEWATYRQALRDLMGSYTDSADNDLDSVTFPTKPS